MDATNVDTRFDWFGTVPDHWRIARNKNAFQIVRKKVGERSTDYNLLSLTLRGIKLRDVESGKGKFPESFDTYQEVQPRDIIFCLFDIDETPRTVGLSSHMGMITGAYTVVRCTKLADPRFVTYFYLSIDQRKGLRPFYTGLRKVVRSETFLNASFPLPDRETQKAIADFLDRETTRIDQLIEKKQRLVALLKECRSARITAAVTGQTDTTSYAKSGTSAESGGGVSFWPNRCFSDLQPLKRVCRLNPEALSEMTDPDYEFDYIDIGNVTLEGGVVARERMRFEDAPSRARKSVCEGDVIVSTVRTYLRAVAGIGQDADNWIVSTGFAVLRSKSGTEPRFLYRAVQSNPFVESVVAASTGVSYPAIDESRLGNIRVPLPDLETQKTIADYLDRETTRIDRLVEKTEQSINRLREHRAALITAAVTGQLDVTT